MKWPVLAVSLVLPMFAVASAPEPTQDDGAQVRTESPESAEAQVSRIPPLLPMCWDLDLTACSSVGATTGCQDGIYTDYVCTCRQSTIPSTPSRYWDCPEVR
ncbi:hypothetical protein JGU66_03165 [Myxococcaceae bacterium JPH2]|nr:hypothetical protein [Myxococcaceae bacterium JPH2]